MRYLWLCMLLIGFIPTYAQEPSHSDAPYLYYYSDIVDGFVIERADGTDSRVLGEGLVPDETAWFSGAGWSPSGEWFAFINVKSLGFNHSQNLNAVAVHVSGKRHLSTLEDITAINQVNWVPNKDILIVKSGLYDAEPEIYTYYWIDATSDRILNQVQIQPSMRSILYEQWLSDGKNYAIAYTSKLAPEYEYTYKILDQYGNLVTNQFSTGKLLGVSTTGWLVSSNNTTLSFQNLEHKAEFTWQFSESPLPDAYIDINFSPNGEYAFIFIDYESYFFVQFGKHHVQKLLYRVMPDEAWSPDSRYFITAGWEDSPSRLFSTETFVDFPLGIKVYQWGWHKAHQLILKSLTDDGSLIYILDTEAYYFERILLLSDVYGDAPPTFSNDLRYLGYVGTAGNIYNLRTGDLINFLPHSGATYSGPGGEIIWHPDSKWFLIADEALVAGGAIGLRWLSVGDITGNINRELVYCGFYQSVCVDWLPEQVDISKLPAGQSTSVMPTSLSPNIKLYMGGETWWEIIWSEDSKNLLFGNTSYDIATGLSAANLELQPALDWELGSSKHYTFVEKFENDTYFTQLVDRATGEIILEFPRIIYKDISPDETLVAISDQDNTPSIEIWSIPERRKLTTIYRGGSALAFSPDSKYLAAGVSWEVWIWETADFYQAE